MTRERQARAIVERYYEAFNAGDIDGMIDCLADEVRHDVNEGAPRIGKDAFRAFCDHMARCYRERLDDIVVMAAESGDRAAAEFIVDGVYLATDEGLPPAAGQRYRLAAGGFFSLEAGAITRVTTYYNLKEWTRQVSEAQRPSHAK